MKIEIVKINRKERIVLEKLLQLYLHDISLYFPMDFDSQTGLYQYDDLDKYFNHSDNFPYFIKCDNNIAGFMLVDKINNEFVMQEMFVLNNYKNKGIGKIAVFECFSQNKGNWIIRSLPCSLKAENFWTKVVKEYSNNNCQIDHVGKFNRAVFTFSMSDSND